MTQGPSAEELLALEVGADDFELALREVTPSAIRELGQELQPAAWSDIGGLSEVKRQLREMVEAPLRTPQRFAALGVEPPRGVLLSGPPGTGKTLTARAVAQECSANFITVSGAQLLSKFYGESEEAIRELFVRARAARPCIVFIDEIDALLPRRDARDSVSERVVGQFLTEMDGAVSSRGVIVIGATNRPEALDAALLRGGRFELQLHFGLPDAAARAEILELHLRSRPTSGVEIAPVAARAAGWSGADLAALVRSAALIAVSGDASTITQQHLLEALERRGV